MLNHSPRSGQARKWTLAAAALLAVGLSASVGLGDEPRGLGRLFRLGGGNNSSNNNASQDRKDAPAATGRPGSGLGGSPAPALLGPPGYNPAMADVGAGPYTPPPAGYSPQPPATGLVASPAVDGAGARIRPQPRVNRAATEADPILTQVALGRTDDGKQFSMLMQVYADGTVIDNEGVHRLGPDAIRPIVNLVQSTDLVRLEGHCGGPPASFIEQVYVVVYDRALGRLRANHFSYSGNTHGCDPAVKELQAAVEALQNKISGAPTTIAEPAVATTTTPAPAGYPPTTYGTTLPSTEGPPPPTIILSPEP